MHEQWSFGALGTTDRGSAQCTGTMATKCWSSQVIRLPVRAMINAQGWKGRS